MRQVTRAVLATLIVTYLAAFAFFLFVSFFSFPARDVMAQYYWQWVLSDAVVRLVDTLIPIHCAALLLAYSLFVKDLDLRPATGDAPGFSRVVRSTVIMLLVLTVGYAAVLEWLAPGREAARQQTVYNTALARELLARANRSYKNEDFPQALTQVEEYLALSPDDEDAQQLRSNSIQNLPASGSQTSAGTDAMGATTLVGDLSSLTAPELLDKANEYLKSEDFFSAYYYASLALKLDPGLTDARRIMSRSTDQIRSIDMSTMQKKQADIFAEKQKGFLALQNGDAIQAYYVFSDLKNVVPNDADVNRYYPQALDAVRGVAFFRDEVTDVLKLPGTDAISFVNRSTDEYRELISIGKLIQAPEGAYALDVELIRYAPAGNVVLHLSVPYAKFVGQYLVMHAIGKNDSSVSVVPTVYTGAVPDKPGPIFEIMAPVGQLPLLAAGAATGESVGLIRLWNSADDLARFGHAVRPLYQNIAMRLLLPFSFITLSLFSISFGWRFRSRYLGRPPLGAIALIPALFVAVYYLYRVYIYAFRVILGFTAVRGGLTLTIIVLVAVQAVLLAGALLSLAVQSAD